jgi:hypothetical protein
MTGKIAHLVFRLPRGGQRLSTVIAQHNDVVTRRGSVWFGVQGPTLSTRRSSFLLDQLERQIPTHLYAVQGEGAGFLVFRAKLLTISARLSESELALVPEYYVATKMLTKAKRWIRVEHFEAVQEQALDSLLLYVGGTSLIQALRRGMASLMMVSFQDLRSRSE